MKAMLHVINMQHVSYYLTCDNAYQYIPKSDWPGFVTYIVSVLLAERPFYQRIFNHLSPQVYSS